MQNKATRLLLISLVLLGSARIGAFETRLHLRCWTIPGCGASCSCRRDDCLQHCASGDGACQSTCQSNYQSCLEGCL